MENHLHGIVPDAFLDKLAVKEQAARWRALLEESGSCIFVAEDGGEVFGFVSGGVLREPLRDYDAELYAIYLLESRPRQGGRALSGALRAELEARGFQSLLVWVLEANPCMPFYKRIGGVEEARKLVSIGDVELPELAFGWPHLHLMS